MLKLWTLLILLMAGTSPADDPVKAALSGLTETQKKLALKVLNEQKCPCGCTKGTIAQCRRKDSQCSTAPRLITQVVSLSKEGKSEQEILKQIKTTDPEKASPSEPVMVSYRRDDPALGAMVAKVTIIEFSDFQ
jgi:protein-disulfide isomerase